MKQEGFSMKKAFALATVLASFALSGPVQSQSGMFRLANNDPGASGHVLDVTTVFNGNEVYLALLPASNAPSQVWQYRETFFGDWRLWNAAQGKDMCAKVINTEDIQMLPCNDDLGHNWQARQVPGGINLTNDEGGNTCLDYTPLQIPNGQTIGGAVMRPCNGSASQVWRLVPYP